MIKLYSNKLYNNKLNNNKKEEIQAKALENWFLLSLVHTSDGSGDGDGSGSYRLRLRPSENWYDGSGDGSLTFVFSIIKTTFKMADEKDAILLLFVFILFRLWRRRRRLAQLKRRRTFWVRQLFADRKTSGEYWILVLQMKGTDRELYFRYVDFSEYSLF